MSPAKILIVEDEPMIAYDIALNLEAHGYEIAGVLHSAEEIRSTLNNKTIDLVMLDINLDGEMSGIEIAKILDTEYGIPFIYLTSYSDSETLEQAASTFPSAYLVKPFKEKDLAPAVQMALAKKRDRSDQRAPSINRINNNRVAKITNAEYAIILELWAGKTNQEIANAAFLSPNTVKTHVKNIYSKIGVHSKPELIAFLRDIN
ncbi:MAG: response regulator [Bacteroidetes bacterium]|nr:MAG: response regulator [Bacteroidota bacterium]